MNEQHAQMLLEEQQAQLAHRNGSTTTGFREQGTTGLDIFSGMISRAYLTELQWPTVQPVYDRMWRSDPEIAIQRIMMGNAAGDQSLRVEIPAEVEKPTDDDKRFAEFYEQALVDMDINRFWRKNTATTPFLGWAWWTTVAGLRKKDWHPPDRTDTWSSQFDDGLTGIRRLAWRDHSSFSKWEIPDDTGRMTGMWQHDFPNPEVLLPLDESVHMTFGDEDNPEGLATLEAVYRLERVKFALEVVQGIGFEHAAGHLKFTQTENTGTPTAGDKALMEKAARAVLSGQQGNFLLVPYGYEGDIMDVPFAAAPDILAAIKYYTILKLGLLGMQWIAMSTLSGVGSQAALKDSTTVWISMFNSMQKGFASQLDKQIGKWLLDHNREAFPNLTMRARIVAPKVQKLVELGELGKFYTELIAAGMPMDDADLIEIRRKSDFLPETLPDVEEEQLDANVDGNGVGVSRVSGEKIADQQLNGAQITSLMTIILNFSAGLMTKESAKALINAAYKSVSDSEIEQMLQRADEEKATAAVGAEPKEGSDIPDEEKPEDDDAEQSESEDAKTEGKDELTARDGFRISDVILTQIMVAQSARHPLVVELQGSSGLFRAAAKYESQLTTVVQTTLQRGTPAEAQKQKHDNILRSGIAFEAYAQGMRAGGSQQPNFDMTEDDIVIIESWISSQIGFTFPFAQRAEEVGRMDDDDPQRASGVAEVNGRIFLWVDALISLAGLGKLAVLKNPALTFDGPDGKESCRECQQWKGKRHTTQFWRKRGLLGRNGNPNFTCGRWVCQHSFFADDGELVVL